MISCILDDDGVRNVGIGGDGFDADADGIKACCRSRRCQMILRSIHTVLL